MDLEPWLSQLRAEVVARGPGWLQAAISGLIQEPGQAPSAPSPTPTSQCCTRARISRPPERFSLEVSWPVRERLGAPLPAVPTDAAQQTPVRPSEVARRDSRPQRTWGGGAASGGCSSPPASGASLDLAASAGLSQEQAGPLAGVNAG